MMLAIYRCCGLETDKIGDFRPPWFDKLKCFKLFYEAYKKISDIVVVYDGPESKLSEYIRTFPIKFIKIDYQSNLKSLYECYDIPLRTEFKNTDSIVIQEDDYAIRPEAGRVMLEGITSFGLYTTYLHADRFLYPQTDITYGKDYIFLGEICYHRSVESTTCSFGVSRQMFLNIHPKLYSFNLNDRRLFRDLCQSNIRLFSSMPGFSSHCCVQPYNMMGGSFFDWGKLMESVKL